MKGNVVKVLLTVGGVLLTIGGALVDNQKEKIDRQEMEDEITANVMNRISEKSQTEEA